MSLVSRLRRSGSGILGLALVLGLVACGSAGVVTAPTETAAGAPGSPATGSGAANLDWTPVTENTDGTALTNLAGYNVYYGTSQHALTRVVQVPNPGATTYPVTDLASGTWYFAVTAYTSDGAESALSNIQLKSIP